MNNQTIGNVLLDLSLYNPDDVYSDGEIEEEMLRIAKTCSQIEIADLMNTTDSWPVFYHFSSMRENILNWYPFQSKASVLEIGAGCGAVTGALIGKCKSVTALDLSLRRCQINAWRHKESKNLKIQVANFQTFAEKCKEKFNYITLIGVFEYAASYIASESPYADLLNMANDLLKPDGKLLIAIENRFGAKYFAGCAEDHLGTFFTGIEGYDPKSRVRTFNRKEWQNLFNDSGYDHVAVYYPYPDYKFPLSIYSDERLPKRGELMRERTNFDRDRCVLFSENKFWDSLVGTDYFRDFSNSFLFEITKKEV